MPEVDGAQDIGWKDTESQTLYYWNGLTGYHESIFIVIQMFSF